MSQTYAEAKLHAAIIEIADELHHLNDNLRILVAILQRQFPSPAK